MTAHEIRRQKAMGARFAVCSCDWRSGVGDVAQVEEQVKQHLRLVGGASKATVESCGHRSRGITEPCDRHPGHVGLHSYSDEEGVQAEWEAS